MAAFDRSTPGASQREDTAEFIEALSALSPLGRQIVEILIRRVSEMEHARGEQAAHAMLYELEQALSDSDLTCSKAEHENSVWWSQVQEDCELGLDSLLAAMKTLSLETNSEPEQQRHRSAVIDQLCASIQIAIQALDDIRAAQVLPEDKTRYERICEKPPSNTKATALGLRDTDVVILQYAAEGMVDKMIAQQLNQDPRWVHHRWRSVRSRLGAADRTHAVGIAMTLGFILPPAQAVCLLKTIKKTDGLN